MAYRTKTVDFGTLLSHLEDTNKFAHNMFCEEHLKNTELWHNHVYNETINTNNELVLLLKCFLDRNDRELSDLVFLSAQKTCTHFEVLEHFEQDKDPLTLMQEFECAIRVESDHQQFNDRLSMFRNEY